MRSPYTILDKIKEYYKNDPEFKKSISKLAKKLGLKENVILRKLAIASIVASAV